MENDTFKMIGVVKLDCYTKDGKLKWSSGWMKNTIANTGKAVCTGLIGNVDAQTAFGYLAVGTSATAESAAHTALQAEIIDSGLERAAATVSRVTTITTNDTIQFTYTWTASGSKTVQEVGIFNDPTAGVMLARKLTGAKSVDAAEQLQATYKIILS